MSCKVNSQQVSVSARESVSWSSLRVFWLMPDTYVPMMVQ